MSTGKRVFVCLYICLSLIVLPLSALGANRKTGEAAVRSALVKAYRDYFGLDVPFPAYVKAASSKNTYYYTSAAYIGTTRYRVYLHEDGTVEANACNAKRPQGTYRVAVVAIDHGNTNIAALLDTLWVQVQQEINANYEAFSIDHGLTEPILRFANTNLLASSSQIANPRNSADIISFVESNGYRKDDFDIFVALDLDPSHPSGGSADYGGNFVYLGYYSSLAPYADLSQPMSHGEPQLFWFAKTVYDHECGHIFGWEHEWTPVETNRLSPNEFITSPILYGWTDTDGDSIPEILDPAPYGMAEAAAAMHYIN